MSRLAAFAVVLAAVFPLVAAAATEHRFTVVSQGAYPSERHGRLIVDGDRWRIDRDGGADEVRVWDSVVNVGSRRLAINHERKTWFVLDSFDSSAFAYSPFMFDRSRQARAEKPKVELARTADGGAILEFRYRARFDLAGQSVRSRVAGTFRVSTKASGEGADALWILIAFGTGIDAIDKKLGEKIRTIGGVPIASALTVSRTFDGGKPIEQTIRISIDSTAPVAVGPADFEVPRSYREEAPQLGVPSTSH